MTTNTIPPLGFGTMESYNDTSDMLVQAISTAMQCGFQHFDTAELYQSTESFKVALSEQPASIRDSIFITSKLKGLPSGEYAAVKQRTETLLSNLGIKQLDLLLIHWPGPEDLNMSDPSGIEEKASFAYFKENIAAAWENMKKLRSDNLVKFIGVSNFYKQHISELLTHVTNDDDKPFANELFIDLFHQETDYVQFLQSLNVRVIAYRSVVFLNVHLMVPEVEALVQKYKVANLAYLVFAWLTKRNIHVVAKTMDKEKIASTHEAVSLVPQINLEDFEGLEGNETIEMFGAADEFATAFKGIS